MTLDEVRAILADVKFAPSCVDMCWEWEVKEIRDYDQWEDQFHPGGFLVRTTFQRPDRDTGVVSKGYGRWWHVPSDVTESGVVKTAFAAAKMILEHELMESFHYNGFRIFDPHHTVDELALAAYVNGIENGKSRTLF